MGSRVELFERRTFRGKVSTKSLLEEGERREPGEEEDGESFVTK